MYFVLFKRYRNPDVFRATSIEFSKEKLLKNRRQFIRSGSRRENMQIYANFFDLQDLENCVPRFQWSPENCVEVLICENISLPKSNFERFDVSNVAGTVVDHSK